MTTGRDDGLAPVTPLFGRHGGGPAPEDESAPAAVAGAEERETTLARISSHWSGSRDTVPPEGIVDAGSDPEAEAEPEPEGLDAQRRRAENVSMHALARRGVSSGEMERLLRDRELDESVVADEVARLEGVGLLDDVQLARDLVESWQRRKGLGRQALASELRQRRLAPDAVETALDEIDGDDEQGRADEWARKRASSLRGLDRETAERRLSGYLQRRGYRGDVVRRAVDRALPRGGSRGGGVRFE